MFEINGTLPTEEDCRAFFEKNAAPSHLKVERLQMEVDKSDASDVDSVVDTVKEASLMGANSPVIIAFADGVSPDKRQAVLNCIALSELYANKKADRKTEAVKWHEHYTEVMQYCGWAGTNHAFKEYNTSNVNVTMDSLVLEIISIAAGANAAALLPMLTKVFSVIQSDSKLITLFDNNSSNSSVGSCQIMPCVESSSGIAVTVMTALECKFSRTEGGSWFWKWKVSSMSVKNSASVVNFNFEHYKRLESSIFAGLDGSSRRFFDKVNSTI